MRRGRKVSRVREQAIELLGEKYFIIGASCVIRALDDVMYSMAGS
jgi:hypothetical protein